MGLNGREIKIVQPLFHFGSNRIDNVGLADEFSFDEAGHIIPEELQGYVGLLIPG